jgi:hypothetical protein
MVTDNSPAHDWPTAIQRIASRLVGNVTSIEPLGGMSGSAVVRIHGERGTAALKRSTCPAETHIYTVAAEVLRKADIGLPDLYLAHQESGSYWLLLEDIPHALPRERWLADAEMIDTLRRLHAIDPQAVVPPDPYVPIWTAEMTAQAQSLTLTFDADLRSRLDLIRERCQALFRPTHVISGDPNPANWGLRDDRSLVLYDWERVTLGSPAMDLAITVPGLGSPSIYATVAASYHGDEDCATLARDIADAKVWTVIELLSACARGEATPSFRLESLTSLLPDWLCSLNPGD